MQNNKSKIINMHEKENKMLERTKNAWKKMKIESRGCKQWKGGMQNKKGELGLKKLLGVLLGWLGRFRPVQAGSMAEPVQF